MYKSVITIDRNTPPRILEQLAALADRAFDNRAGRVENSSQAPYELLHQGDEGDFGCLSLGLMTLGENREFLARVEAWQWIDEEEPEESCDVLEELRRPVKGRRGRGRPDRAAEL